MIVGAAVVAQMVKNLSAMQETQVQALGWEDPLEKGMTTHSSILAWKTPWTEEPGRLHSWGSKESETTERITLSHFHNRGAGSCKHSPFASWENGQHLWQKVLRGPLYRERQEEGVFCFRCNLLLFLLVHNQH